MRTLQTGALMLGLWLRQESRYPLAAASNLVASGLFLLLLAKAGSAFGREQAGLLLAVGFMVMAGMQGPVRAVERSREELFLVRWPLALWLVLESLGLGVWTALQLFLVLEAFAFLGLAEIGHGLAFFKFAPLAFGIGLGPGLALAGAALVFKRTGALLNLFSLGVLGAALFPAFSGAAGALLPYLGLVRAVAGGEGLVGVGLGALGWLVGGALIAAAARAHAVRTGRAGVG